MHLGSFNSWINYTIYYKATKKKPLKSSVSKEICILRSRLWHTATAAGLGCMGRFSAQNRVLLKPSGYSEGNKSVGIASLHVAAQLVRVIISDLCHLHSMLLSFSLSSKMRNLFLLKYLSLEPWDIKPSNIWANRICENIAMIGSTVVLQTHLRKIALLDCDNHCPFLCPYLTTVVKVEPGLCLLPAYSHLLFAFLVVQLRHWSFNDYSVRKNFFILLKGLCTS